MKRAHDRMTRRKPIARTYSAVSLVMFGVTSTGRISGIETNRDIQRTAK